MFHCCFQEEEVEKEIIIMGLDGFKNLCVLLLQTKVTLALEGLLDC